ncbi:phage portal protein, partial [Pseudomonas typographi]
NWGTGLEQKLLRFLTFTLRSYMRRIEEGISRSLLSASDRRLIYPEFAIEGLLRADSAARSAFYSQMVQNGIYTRDDCRIRENLPRRGGNADVLTVQTNLSPIDQLGQSTDGQAARAALQNWLNQPEPPKE